jgi:short-subunit dehydrogenase
MQSTTPIYPDLAGKVAVVTGGSRGIGAATCRMLAANGARVVVNGRDRAALQQTVDEIRAGGGEATAVAADAADLAALERLREETERAYGPAEVLGAFVAGGGPLPGPTAQITEPEWEAAIRGNLGVTFLTLRCFLPGMVERGRGAILNVASTASFQPLPMQAGYAATKAFVLSFTESLHAELGHEGIAVTALCPGPVKTEFVEIANLQSAEATMPGFLWETPDVVAKAGIRGLERGKRVVIPGVINRVGAVSGQHAPRSLVLALATRVHPAARD